MAVYTGIVGSITVSGVVISGSKGCAECTVVIGKQRGKFDAIGTDVSEHTRGMKEVSGTLRRKWVSGEALFQELLDDDDNEFEVTLQISGQTSISASGCVGETITRRAAPGTDVMMEEMPFTAREWY